MDSLETWLERVYGADGDRATLDEIYDEWARQYDENLWASGNPYIAIGVGMLGRFVPELDTKILDAGCGTGNMAQILHEIGYTDLQGMDPSSGMLAMAERKNIYKNLYPLALSEKVDLPDESFGAVVAMGVLTHGHAPPESLVGILRLLKPGGVVVFSLSQIAYEQHGFDLQMSKLESDNEWTPLGQSRLFRTYPFSEKEADLRHWVYAYRKRN